MTNRFLTLGSGGSKRGDKDSTAELIGIDLVGNRIVSTDSENRLTSTDISPEDISSLQYSVLELNEHKSNQFDSIMRNLTDIAELTSDLTNVQNNVDALNLNVSNQLGALVGISTEVADLKTDVIDLKNRPTNSTGIPSISYDFDSNLTTINGTLDVKGGCTFEQDVQLRSMMVGSQYIFITDGTLLTLRRLTEPPIVIGQPKLSSSNSYIQSSIDYSYVNPVFMFTNAAAMLEGNNRCWGHTEVYIAGENLLAGRVVSLGNAENNQIGFSVVYVKQTGNDEQDASIFPIGITQNNALVGEKITVCTTGYTTVITDRGSVEAQIGSLVSTTGNEGKVTIDRAASINEGRLGFVAQKGAVFRDGPCFIYIRGWYQAA